MATVLFYYKDRELINSLYAQLFSGLIKEIATTEAGSEDNSLDVAGKGEATVSALVAKGEFGITTKGNSTVRASRGRQETMIPHDTVILDVLEKLGPAAKTNLSEAERGDIINVKGSLLFFPKELEATSLEPLLPFLEGAIAQNLKTMERKQKNALTGIMKNFLKTGSDNCRFIFKTETENFLTGYMKRSDFTEDSLSLFFRYKASMIPCQLIGIMESHPSEKLPEETEVPSLFQGLVGMQTAAAEIWSQGLPDADTITPITFFLPLKTVI
ncbi:MAG: hypothetical protein HDQ92_03495 [Desulfovibrio sp.]|nr:hypothetical protein [Desulfovibrio sp.]